MKQGLILTIFLTLGFTSLTGQSVPLAPAPLCIDIELKVLASTPTVLKEASGLETTSSGLLWTHNDDHYAILYGLDNSGRTIKTVHLNHPNRGWEDLARDTSGNLYIGGFGNNQNDRRSLSIYKIPEPENIHESVFTAEIIEYTYADQHAFPPTKEKQNFDVDAMISKGDSLYLFTKNRTEPFCGLHKSLSSPPTCGYI